MPATRSGPGRVTHYAANPADGQRTACGRMILPEEDLSVSAVFDGDVTCEACRVVSGASVRYVGNEPLPKTEPPTRGLRFNSGKLPLGLISPWAMEGLAAVLAHGAKKYAVWNWAKGLSWSETIDSLERHLTEFKKGVPYDPESGQPHVFHILCNAMFLAHFWALGDKYQQFDDRWKP